jgi:hypothetical protein
MESDDIAVVGRAGELIAGTAMTCSLPISRPQLEGP